MSARPSLVIAVVDPEFPADVVHGTVLAVCATQEALDAALKACQAPDRRLAVVTGSDLEIKRVVPRTELALI